MSRQQKHFNNRQYVFGNRDLWLKKHVWKHESIRDAYEGSVDLQVMGTPYTLYVYDVRGELIYVFNLESYCRQANRSIPWNAIVNNKVIKGNTWKEFIINVGLELEEQADADVQLRGQEQLAQTA